MLRLADRQADRGHSRRNVAESFGAIVQTASGLGPGERAWEGVLLRSSMSTTAAQRGTALGLSYHRRGEVKGRLTNRQYRLHEPLKDRGTCFVVLPQFSRRSKAKKAEVCKPWLVTGAVLRCAMTKALQLAMAKAAALPDSRVQEQARIAKFLGKYDRLNELRAANQCRYSRTRCRSGRGTRHRRVDRPASPSKMPLENKRLVWRSGRKATTSSEHLALFFCNLPRARLQINCSETFDEQAHSAM